MIILHVRRQQYIIFNHGLGNDIVTRAIICNTFTWNNNVTKRINRVPCIPQTQRAPVEINAQAPPA